MLFYIAPFSTIANNQLDNSFYISASIGSASYEEENKTIGELSIGIDDKQTSYGVVLGYKINNYFAIEGGYTDLGKFFADKSYTEYIPDPINDDVRVKHLEEMGINGITLALALQYPIIDRVNIFSKFGLYQWKSDSNYTLIAAPFDENIPTTTLDFNKSQDDNDIFYSLGLAYQWEDFAISTEYRVFNIENDNIALINLNFSYYFNL